MRRRRGDVGPWEVVLRRGPLGTRTWTHQVRGEAWRRAERLAELHGVEAVVERTDQFVVDAADYYAQGGAEPWSMGVEPEAFRAEGQL